jgi:5'-methylthioadenosine phosphorylase
VGRLAVTGGHGILGTEFAADASRLDIDTIHGPASLLDAGSHVVIQRHGLDEFVSAPFINHRAHVRALADAGCDRILGVASVGSLRRDLPVGTFVAPDDFIALHLGISFSAGDEGHQAPSFDPVWRRTVADRWADETDVPLYDGGVYWQAIGPRFETPAEIRLIAAHADVVGMTVGSECVVAGELGLQYAALCMVDNLANGLGPAQLSVAGLERDRAANAALLRDGLEAVLPRLGAVGR